MIKDEKKLEKNLQEKAANAPVLKEALSDDQLGSVSGGGIFDEGGILDADPETFKLFREPGDNLKTDRGPRNGPKFGL